MTDEKGSRNDSGDSSDFKQGPKMFLNALKNMFFPVLGIINTKRT